MRRSARRLFANKFASFNLKIIKTVKNYMFVIHRPWSPLVLRTALSLWPWAVLNPWHSFSPYRPLGRYRPGKYLLIIDETRINPGSVLYLPYALIINTKRINDFSRGMRKVRYSAYLTSMGKLHYLVLPIVVNK